MRTLRWHHYAGVVSRAIYAIPLYAGAVPWSRENGRARVEEAQSTNNQTRPRPRQLRASQATSYRRFANIAVMTDEGSEMTISNGAKR